MATTPAKIKEFDLKSFQEMQEPITIRIERFTNGRREPIPLPNSEWRKEDAEKIERYILTDIAGGGSYEGQMSDPNGKSFTWRFGWPEAMFPAKVPAGSQAGLQPAVAAQLGGNGQQVAAAPPGTVWMPTSTAGYPQTPAYTPTVNYPPQGYQPPQQGFQQPQQPQQQPGYPPMPYYQSNPITFPWSPPPAVASTPARSAIDDSKTEALQRELAEMRTRVQDESHRREREAAEARHQAEINATQASFKEELRSLREMVAQKPRSEDDPAIVAIRAQNDTLQRQIAEAQQRHERDQAEARFQMQIVEMQRALKDQADATARALKDQADAMQRMIEKIAEAKPDPVMPMLVELQKAAVETQREAQRNAVQLQIEQARQAAAAPQQLLSVVEGIRRTSGSDQLLGNVAQAYEGAMGIAQRNMEMFHQMMQSQQGSPVVGMIQEGIGQGKELIATYIKSKQSAEIAGARVEQARAQERTAVAQAQAQAMRMASMPRPPVPEQLAGVTADREAEEARAEREKAEAELQAAEAKLPKEADLFGVAWDEVVKLRELAAAWEKNHNDEDSVGPDEAALGVVKGAIMMQQNGISIPIYALLTDKRYADLVDHLVPNASAEYRGVMVKEVEKLVRAVEVNGPSVLGDDDEDDDDETEE